MINIKRFSNFIKESSMNDDYDRSESEIYKDERDKISYDIIHSSLYLNDYLNIISKGTDALSNQDLEEVLILINKLDIILYKKLKNFIDIV